MASIDKPDERGSRNAPGITCGGVLISAFGEHDEEVEPSQRIRGI